MTQSSLPTDQYELPRDIAGRLNPLICHHPSDTLGMVADALAFLSEAAEHTEGGQSTEAPQGFAIMLEVTRQAVKYEAHAAQPVPKLRAGSS